MDKARVVSREGKPVAATGGVASIEVAVPLDGIFAEAPRVLFETIAEAHDFDLARVLPIDEARRLAGFLRVAEQAEYEKVRSWPAPVFQSALLTCKLALSRAMRSQGVGA
jgi:hypothetical protein